MGIESRKTKEEVERLLNSVDMKMLDGEVYKNSGTPVSCIDSYGYKYRIRIDDIISGTTKFRIVQKSNKFSLENISLWLILNNIKFRLKDNQIYERNSKDLIFICDEHGEFTRSWANLTSYKECPYCNNSPYIINEERTILNAKPELIIYLKNKIDAETTTINSGKFLDLICPECGKERKMVAHQLCNVGFSCRFCSDTISIPEKFFMGLFEQLNIEYINQKQFEFSNDRRYDFYFKINDKEYLCEVHGEHHYKHTGRGRSLKEEQENDLLKYNLAIQNGFNNENYIVINCRKSELEWLVENYTKQLGHILNLSSVDWNKVFEFCMSSLVVKSIELWNNNFGSPSTIGEKLKISKATVIKYLKRGNELGLCNYDVKKQQKIVSPNQKRKISQFDLDGNYIRDFESAIDASNSVIGGDSSSIIKCCKGKIKYSKGYIWKYSEL